MALMNINLTGTPFTDYHLVNVGAGVFQLEHDWWTKEDLVIRTAPAWGGTLLIEGTDYTLGTKSNELSARVSAAGPERQVFHQITIINATYQSGDLYFSGKYIADSNEAGDINALQDQLGAHTALTGSSAHGAVSAPTASQLMTRDAAGRAQVVAPSVAADIATKGYVDGLSGLALLYIEDQKPANTQGGTSVAGAWTQRVLNTVVTNSISGASLASNRITLPAGTYFVEASAPAYGSSRHKLKLYNYTDSTDILIGSSEQVYYGADVQTRSHVKGPFTLDAQHEVELRHRVENGFTAAGFGIESNMGVIEVYSQIEIRKIA